MKKLYLALFVMALFAVPTVSFANVYACDLHSASDDFTFGTSTPLLSLYYRLNADCTTVTIKIFEESTPGTAVRTIVSSSDEYTSAGIHEYQWDGLDDFAAELVPGNYSFSVTAQHDGYSVWTSILTANSYYAYQERVQMSGKLTCDIKAVRDKTSPYYGRIYWTSAHDGTFLSNPVNAGVYAMDSNLSCYSASNPWSHGNSPNHLDAYAACSINSSVDWVAGTAGSFPDSYNSFLSRRHDGVDGFVVVNGSGVSGASQAIYLMGLDGSLLSSPLNTATNPYLTDPRHAYISGTGADRKLYVEDWGFAGPGANGNTVTTAKTNIWCYAIGTTDSDYSATPTLALYGGALPGNGSGGKWRGSAFIPGTTDMIILGGESLPLATNNAGIACELWPASAVATTTGAASQVVWSVTRDRWCTDTGEAIASTSNTCENLSVSPDGSTVYIGSYRGRYAGYDVTTGASIAGTGYQALDSGGGFRSHLGAGADIDPSGNMLMSCYYYGGLQMWSPPGANSMTTSWADQGSGGLIAITYDSSVDDWTLY